MKFTQDPRVKVARKAFAISWIFFGAFVLLGLSLSYSLGLKPLIFGLPRWLVIGAVLVPTVFVILVIFIAEKFIPDIPLTDEEAEGEKNQ